jgi:hypothetical protein
MLPYYSVWDTKQRKQWSACWYSSEREFAACRHLDDQECRFCAVFLNEWVTIMISFCRCRTAWVLESWIHITVAARMWVYVCFVFCLVQTKNLRPADHSCKQSHQDPDIRKTSKSWALLSWTPTDNWRQLPHFDGQCNCLSFISKNIQNGPRKSSPSSVLHVSLLLY